MSKLIPKIIWNALAIVGLVLIIIWIVWPPGQPPLGPTATVTSGPPILEAIKHVNKQIFIEHYSMVDVQYSETATEWLPFLRQDFVVLLRGRIPAGFDLQQLKQENIWTSSDGKRVQLTLPPPVIFEDNVSIDFENSRILSVKDTCPNFLCEENLKAYQSQVLPQGRDVLIEFARQSGILDQAAQDGKIYYEQFLKSLGYEEVQIIVTGYGL